MKFPSKFSKNEQGVGLLEYILTTALIVLVAIAAITTVGTKVSSDITSAANNL